MQAGAQSSGDAVSRAPALDECLARAHQLAVAQGHATVALEHLLFSLTEDPDAVAILGASAISIEQLRIDVSGHLGRLSETAGSGGNGSPRPGADLLRILQLAGMAARQSQRRSMDGGIVLAAIIGDGNSPAAGLLKAHGLTFEDVIRVLQTAGSPRQQEIAPAASRAGLPAPAADPAPAPPPPPARQAVVRESPARSGADDAIAVARARVRQSEPAALKPLPTPPPVTVEQSPQPSQLPSRPAAAAPANVEPPRADPTLPELPRQDVLRAEPAWPDARRTPPLPEPPPTRQPEPRTQPITTPLTEPPPPLASPPPLGPRVPQPPLAPPPLAPPMPGLPPAPRPGPVPQQASPYALPQATTPPAMPPPHAPRQMPSVVSRPVIPQPAQHQPQPHQAPQHQPPQPQAPPPMRPPQPAFRPDVLAQQAPAPHPGALPVPASPPASPYALMPGEPLEILRAAAGLPASVRRNVPVLIEIRIPRGQVDVPRHGSQAPPPHHHVMRAVTTRLTSGPVSGVSIEPRTPETAWLGPADADARDVVWQYVLLPTRAGTYAVTLSIAGRTVSPAGLSNDVTTAAETFAVRVRPERGRFSRRLFGTVLLLAIGGGIGWALTGPLAGVVKALVEMARG